MAVAPVQRCLRGAAQQHSVLRRGVAAAHGAPARQGAARRSSCVSVRASMTLSNRDNKREARPENVAGSFFVDRTCIDCDTCRWMAPDTFGRVGEQSAVVSQPGDHSGRVQAMTALLSCPTYSIHVTDRSPAELKEAQQALPAPVPGVPGVMYTGWTTEKSFAGCPYLILREEGNILVDSPRFNPVLARRLAELGGVRYMFLTHKDDVGDHQAWAQKLGAQRIIHELEANARQGTDKAEVFLRGTGPWVIRPGDGAVVAAEELGAGQGQPDVTLVFTPGHAAGHVCLFHEPSKALFSGDHLCSAVGEVEGARPDQLHIMTEFNWYSVPEQVSSVAKLLDYDWLHVLPAHGRRAHLRDAAHRLQAVSSLLQLHGHGGAAAPGRQRQQEADEEEGKAAARAAA